MSSGPHGLSPRCLLRLSVSLFFALTLLVSGCSPSPEGLCEKHAKDKVEECSKEMEKIKETLGDEAWKDFAKCADDADGEKGFAQCFDKALKNNAK